MLATGSTLFPFLASEARLRHRAGRDITKVVAVDLFAGGGGVSLGIKWATGRAPLVAVNHCEHAIKIHRLNHPETRHYQESVGDVNPRLACMGKHIDLLWLSPDCTDHSSAKGGKPRSTGRRHLADCALDWARDVAPDVIILENVPEFEDWGPLHPDDHPNPKLRGQPDRARRGQEFKRWCEALAAFGYVMEWRKLVCADYGDPTTRKRFFLIARCDGEPIVWPVPSHGPKAEQPWGIVADCIDWSIPACSIFASPAEAKA
jgi:DNA (cytosine-5)-methyltransferase 1